MRKPQPLMEFIFECFPVDRFSTGSIAVRVASLHDKTTYDTVENCVVVVAFQTKLDEVPACFRGFFRPQFNVDVADGCFQENLQFEN